MLIFTGILVILSGFYIAYLDSRWAYPDERHKFWPTFSIPKSKKDFCWAVVGIFIKLFFLFFFGTAACFRLVECVIPLISNFTVFYCMLILICCVFTPTIFSKQCPTMKELCQEYHQERFQREKEGECKYLKRNFKQFFTGICKFCCLCCEPLKFATTWKALFVVGSIQVWGSILLMLYFWVRATVAAYTYKLFTLQGWKDEMVDIMKMKKRVLNLDYPRFWSENEQRERDEERDKEEKEKEKKEEAQEGIDEYEEEGMQKQAAGEDLESPVGTFEEIGKKQKEKQDKAIKQAASAKDEAEAAVTSTDGLVFLSWPVIVECAVLVFELFLECFGDLIVFLLVLGLAIFLAEKVLEKHNAKQAAMGEEKVTTHPVLLGRQDLVATDAAKTSDPVATVIGTPIPTEDPSQLRVAVSCDRV